MKENLTKGYTLFNAKGKQPERQISVFDDEDGRQIVIQATTISAIEMIAHTINIMANKLRDNDSKDFEIFKSLLNPEIEMAMSLTVKEYALVQKFKFEMRNKAKENPDKDFDDFPEFEE